MLSLQGRRALKARACDWGPLLRQLQKDGIQIFQDWMIKRTPLADSTQAQTPEQSGAWAAAGLLPGL